MLRIDGAWRAYHGFLATPITISIFGNILDREHCLED